MTSTWEKKHEATGQLQKICSHHNKLLEVYCCTDQHCICLLCVMDEHKGHDTVSVVAERTEKQNSAQTEVEDSERIFTELIHSIKTRHSEVTELNRAQEKAEVSWAEGLLEQLEQEVAELRRKDADIKQLSHTEAHIHFLQSFQSLCVLPGSKAVPSISVKSYDCVKKCVSDLKKPLQNLMKKNMVKISGAVKKVYIVPLTDPNTREFLKYSC
uniref:tripartite motif-containing protein 16-like n=1 Tax=Oncorhynchus gorbuscha TaxID=8017 RepID=UPI001EAF5513|nr:tripartite motif-containing protein 16-like [Oncorhynchus gorbuscha]